MTLLKVALLGLLTALPAHAEEPQATEASVRQLFSVMQTRNMLDGMYAQMDSMMHESMKPALAGEALNPDQQRIMDDMGAKTVAILKDGMTWDRLEPILIDIYRKTFTEAEVIGMVRFYESTPGKAAIAKMPIVMRSSMQAGQSLIVPLLPKFQQLRQDTAARLKAASSK